VKKHTFAEGQVHVEMGYKWCPRAPKKCPGALKLDNLWAVGEHIKSNMSIACGLLREGLMPGLEPPQDVAATLGAFAP